MLLFPLKYPRRIRHEKFLAACAAPPAPLPLVSAEFQFANWLLQLVFDRAVNIDGFDASQLIVHDGVHFGRIFTAENPPSQLDPLTLSITLDPGENYAGGGVKLTATPLNVLTAQDDGGAWDGVTDLALPFGE